MAKDNAQGAHPFSGDQPPTDGPDAKYDGTGEPGVSADTPLDPNLAPNMFPREGGSDTYTQIPGDGIVPG